MYGDLGGKEYETWNLLPNHISHIDSLNILKKKNTFLLSKTFLALFIICQAIFLTVALNIFSRQPILNQY